MTMGLMSCNDLKPVRGLGGRVAAGVVLLVGLYTSTNAGSGQRSPGLRSAALEAVETQIAVLFPEVDQLQPAELETLLRLSPERVLLLDVRGPGEYIVSAISGAIHVAVDTRSVADIVRRAGSLDGKIVVAYCSIGLRSSRLIVRIGQGIKEKGAAKVYNLSGGIFRWRNRGGALVGPEGATRAIHPYNVVWRQFLVDAPEHAAADGPR